MNRSFFIALIAAAFAQNALCARFDWPQWQGPDRTAVSKEHGLLQTWPTGGPPLSWTTKGLGTGYSAPSVADGRIFGMSTRGDDNVVWALSETNGVELWVKSLAPTIRQQMQQGQEGPGGTPTVDGDRLYVVSMSGEVGCMQARDGKLLWQRSFQRDFGGSPPTWSYRESPLVDGNKVIVTPGGADATLVALDKMTGEPIWKCQVPGNPHAGYSSAIAIDFEGQRQYVQFTAKSVIGVAAADGKLLWRYEHPANANGINISSPIYDDGKIFAASAYGAGGGLAKLSKDTNGAINAEELWFSKKMQNHHGGMLVIDGYLYGANGGNGGGDLACLDFKTGNVQWDLRDDPQHRGLKGSLALADGRIYYRTEEGTVLLIEPNPKQYMERGRFEQPNRTEQPAWTHPVIANGKLYIRDQDTLYCYDIKTK